MDIEKYIKIKVDMLKNNYSHAQIRNDIFRHVFKECVPNITIDAMIDMCMELYAEVVKRALAKPSGVPQANELLHNVSNNKVAVCLYNRPCNWDDGKGGCRNIKKCEWKKQTDC